MADFGGHESVSKICLLILMFLFVYLNQTHLTDQQNYCVICLDRYILQEITHLSIMFDTLRQLIVCFELLREENLILWSKFDGKWVDF